MINDAVIFNQKKKARIRARLIYRDSLKYGKVHACYIHKISLHELNKIMRREGFRLDRKQYKWKEGDYHGQEKGL